MIRVAKSKTVPESLSRTKNSNGEDVLQQLIADQHGKCYMCERIRRTDFDVEHFVSRSHNSALCQEWSNLLLSCRYCNGRKSDKFDNMLNPVEENIEDEIEQDIDFENGSASFVPVDDSDRSRQTARLLGILFNGKGKIRTIKEKQFFEYFISIMNRFQGLACDYLFNPMMETEANLRNELSIDKEFLGFKYWIVRNNDVLFRVFGKDLVWNKRNG